jgi:hypothetical protein
MKMMEKTEDNKKCQNDGENINRLKIIIIIIILMNRDDKIA